MLSSYRGNSQASSPQASNKPILVSFSGSEPLTNDNFVDNETPTGTINGVNDTFTLSATPSPAASLNLYVNGMRQVAGVSADFVLTGASIVFNAASIPANGSNIRACYRIASA